MAKTLTKHDTLAFEQADGDRSASGRAPVGRAHDGQRPYPASAAPGVFLTPALRLVRPLGEGGMGSVWVAEHQGLLAEVVVKVISKSVEGRPDAAARFAAEAAAAAAIKSPHVVTVFDYGVTERGTPYIVMELLEGEDLGARIARGRMTPRDVVAVVVQMSRALTKAHRAGVVHRDIKPENIFLCEQEGSEIFVKLLDFGTAKSDRSPTPSTSPGELLGTPYYMSPEQIASAGEVDARADVWALGVVAFEALTGQKPFDGGTVAGITLAIHSTLPRVTDAAPELPGALDHWFARACAREPDERYASARDAAEAFYEAITGTPFPENGDSVPILPATPGAIRLASSRPPPRAPREKLSETLPKRGSEKRPILIAAGIVTAAAAMTMAGVVAGWSSPPQAAAEPPLVKSAEPTPKAAAASAAPSTGTPATSAARATAPSVTEATKPAPRSPPAAPPPTREARSAAGTRPRRSPHRKDGAHDGAGHEDDDLLQLQNVDPGPATPPSAPSAKPSAPSTSTSTSTTPVAPSPTSTTPPAPTSAGPSHPSNEPPPLPPADPPSP